MTTAATAQLIAALTNLMVTVETLPQHLPPKVTQSGDEEVEPKIESQEPDAALKQATKLALLRVLEEVAA